MNGVCKFNKCVLCESYSGCDTCGWNPAVFEERKRIQREKIAVARLEEKLKNERKKDAATWRFVSM